MNRPIPELDRLLTRLRGQVRRAWTQRGLGLVAAAVCAAAVTSFVLDYSLDLPLAVRAVHLLMVGAALAVMAWRLVVQPLRIELGDTDIAQAIEHGKPELQDRLISALDFAQRIEAPDEPESRQMMNRVLGEARRMAASVRTADLVDPRPARRALATAAVGCVILLGTALAAGDAFSLWLQRGVLLQDLEWPRRTHVHVLEFPVDGPLVITRGDDVRIVAEVTGKVPRELRLHYEELVDGTTFEDPEIVYRDVRSLYPIEDTENRFALDLRSVASSFRFWVTGGDDDDRRPLYSVKAVIPPRIAGVSARVTYPEYSGLAAETRDLPSLSVLEGSEVVFTLVANMPLAAARLIPLASGNEEEQDGEAEPTRDLVVGGEGGDTLVLPFEVRRTRRFHLELHAKEGHTNRPEDDIFHLIATKDRAPHIQVHYPDTRKFRTPEGLIPVKAAVLDDFGVRSATLEVRRSGGETFSVPVWPRTDDEAAGDGREIPVYVPVDLVTLARQGEAIRPSELIYLVLHAEDNTGQAQQSSEMTIEVISEEAQYRRLAEEQTRLRAMLLRLHQNQKRTRDTVRGLLEQVGDGTPDSAALNVGRDAQVDQGRVTNELLQFERGIERVLDAYALNRLGNVPTLERLLPLYAEFLQKPLVPGEGVFPTGLYDRILTDKRAERLYDPDVVGAVLDVLDLGDQAVADLSPAVYGALQGWSRDPQHPRARLETALAQAEKLDALLRRLDERMQRWEDLNEIVEILVGLSNTQDELAKEVPVDPAPDEEDQ